MGSEKKEAFSKALLGFCLDSGMVVTLFSEVGNRREDRSGRKKEKEFGFSFVAWDLPWWRGPVKVWTSKDIHGS